jgi:CheY-like chemotaxis protein
MELDAAPGKRVRGKAQNCLGHGADGCYRKAPWSVSRRMRLREYDHRTACTVLNIAQLETNQLLRYSGIRELPIEHTMITLRVLVVDDSEVVRRSVCTLLEGEPGLRVISVASDGLQAVKQAREQQPDVILLDISLPGLSGIEAARRIRGVAPRSKILFLSQYDTWATAREALRTGAAGYVVKSDAALELVPGVWSVCHGQSFVSSSLAAHDRRRTAR